MDGLLHLLTGNVYLIVDTLLVAAGLYYVFVAVRGTKAAVLLQGLAILVVLYILCQFLRLITLVFILERLLLIGPIAMLVLFAPEIRALLERASRRSRLLGLLVSESEHEVEEVSLPVLEAVVDALAHCASRNRGALIVLERNETVDDYIVLGTELDAIPSERLLASLFDPSNPLHDGAALLRDDRVHSAGNFLPISESTSLAPELGTRHRAAIGLTERCDAVVAITSEERGELSLAFNGRLARHLSVEQFRDQLHALIEPNANFSTVVPRGVFA